jgi:hypothetical protein
MRRYLTGVLMLLAMASVAAAQQPAAAPSSPDKNDKNAPKTVTLSGCVTKGRGQPNQFTLDDEQNGKYQLSGNQIGRYLGQRVEIAGTTDTGRLKIKGGLWPTPNVAAQGGSIDPVRAAVASQPGGGSSGTGDADLPSFRVKSVKTLEGGCQ